MFIPGMKTKGQLKFRTFGKSEDDVSSWVEGMMCDIGFEHVKQECFLGSDKRVDIYGVYDSSEGDVFYVEVKKDLTSVSKIARAAAQAASYAIEAQTHVFVGPVWVDDQTGNIRDILEVLRAMNVGLLLVHTDRRAVSFMVGTKKVLNHSFGRTCITKNPPYFIRQKGSKAERSPVTYAQFEIKHWQEVSKHLQDELIMYALRFEDNPKLRIGE